MLNLLEVSEMRVQLKGLEAQIASGELSLFERCEVEDQILEIKEALGLFDHKKWDETAECINCSG